ncbi:MAG: hypothetical protein AB1782_16150 [Cyanobacteriota bacterium]
MKYKYNYGQEAIEFILITSLVFFGSLMVVLVFGNKIANFFTNDSSAVKAANASPAIISASNPVKYTPDYTTTDNTKTSYQTAAEEAAAAAAAAAQKTSSGGTPYTINTDGSVSFSVAGQNVMLAADIVQLQDIVMETSGAEGATSLVDEIAYMINKYKAAYPDSNVPLEVAFGNGERETDVNNTSYEGKASVNTISLKVGDNVVIIQNDQSCDGSCSYKGTYRIEGTIDSNNVLKGNVTSNVSTYGETNGNITANINFSNGLSFEDAIYNHYDGYYTSQPLKYEWDINFNDQGFIL